VKTILSALVALACLSLLASCGDSGNGLAGTYVLDSSRTASHGPALTGVGTGAADPARATLAALTAPDVYRLVLDAEGAFSLSIGPDPGAVVLGGSWSSDGGAVQLDSRTTDGVAIPADAGFELADRATVEADGSLRFDGADGVFWFKRL
jgi:hypothetical protein